jgi:hypothetical protein
LGDAPCPACGTLLWFVVSPEGTRFLDRESRLIEKLAARLGVNPNALRDGRLDDLELDSLEVVELIMELDDEVE